MDFKLRLTTFALLGTVLPTALAACAPAKPDFTPLSTDAATGVAPPAEAAAPTAAVAPAQGIDACIKRIERGTKNGHVVVWAFLDCCYLGDIAIMDAATGEVLEFRVGAK